MQYLLYKNPVQRFLCVTSKPKKLSQDMDFLLHQRRGL